MRAESYIDPMPSYLEFIAQGQEALIRADWSQAKTSFEHALSERETPEGHDGLGLALWWLNDVIAAHEQRTQAYLGFKTGGNFQRAAYLAAWLAREQVFLRGNTSAMLGWFARAESLLEEDRESAARGWLDIYRATMVAPIEALKETALHMVQLARRIYNADLEAFALVNAGYAEISLGHVDAGMANIDEAMIAATSGEVADFFVITETFCVTLSACELAGDWVRTQHWCEIAMAYAEKFRSPFLSAYCRTTLGGLLATTGQWDDAEAALTQAIRAFEAGHRALRFHAVIKLADLRLDQGRIEDAKILLEGQEDQSSAVISLARLHLANGDAQGARTLLENALSDQTLPILARAPLLRLYVDVLLAMQDIPGAQKKADELSEIARQSESDFMAAQADLAIGQVKRMANEADADKWFQSAIHHLHGYENSLLGGRGKLELARTLQSTDPHGAAMWAWAVWLDSVV